MGQFIPAMNLIVILNVGEKNLTIYRIPTYSPELNVIEIVWRKIKYNWLPFEAYKSFADLKRELFNVLANIGTSYNVNFS